MCEATSLWPLVTAAPERSRGQRDRKERPSQKAAMEERGQRWHREPGESGRAGFRRPPENGLPGRNG